MSKIVKVSNGDYSLQVQAGGNIILDTTGTAIGRNSAQYGTVTVWGNLDVKGTTTTVESSALVVDVNILKIDQGLGSASGIPAGLNYQSGFEIDRGSYAPAQILFDESVKHYDSTTGLNPAGTFLLRTGISSGTQVLNGLQLRTITTDTSGDLSFDMHGGSHALAIVNVGGTIGVGGHTLTNDAVNYAGTIGTTLQPYHIPNVQWNYGYVLSTLTPSGQGASGTAIVNEIQWPLAASVSPAVAAGAAANVLVTGTLGTNTTYQVQFNVNNATRGYFATTGLTVDNVRTFSNTINNVASNLVLTSTSTGTVELNAVLQLDDQISPPGSNSSGTLLYSQNSTVTTLAAHPGKTGIYFSNSIGTDELISKNRALLLSILF